MAGAKGNGEPGCFSAVLRHLLCRHATSLRPSDVIGYLDSDSTAPGDPCLEIGDNLGGGKDGVGGMSESGRRAGVVARLMGLETLPDVKFCSKSQDTFTRSRSVDLTDYLLEVDLSFRQARQHRHHRVSTSASFREVPVAISTLGPEPRENDLFVVILEKCDEPTDKERETQGKSRKNEVQRGEKKKKSTSDCQSSKESKVLKLRDEPRTRSQASNDRELRRTANARAACEKKCGCSHLSVCNQPEHGPRDVRASDSRAVLAASILDPIIRYKKKAPLKRKKKKKKDPELFEFLEKGKQMDDAVKKAHELAGEEARNSCRLSPGWSCRDKVCVVIEEQVLDGILEEFCKDERVKG